MGLLKTLLPFGAIGVLPGLKFSEISNQRRAVKAQRRLVDIQNRRNALQVAREARAQAANVEAGAAAVGAGDSSGLFGGVGSIGSQFAGNLDFLNQSSFLNRKTLKAQQAAATAGATFDAILSAGQLFAGGGAGGSAPKLPSGGQQLNQEKTNPLFRNTN